MTARAAGPRKKILFVLDSFPGPHGGTESQFWLLVRGLDRTRFEPWILLMRPSPWLEQHAGDIRLRVVEIPRLKSLRGLARIASAARWARRAGFRVAHTFFNDSSVGFPLFLRMAGLSVVVSRRDLGFWYTPGLLKILRVQARFVAAVTANSLAVRDAVVAAEGFAPHRVRVIYNGLLRAPSPACAGGRAAFGVPEGVPLVVVVANLRPLKRVSDVVRALAQLRRDAGIEAHVLVVGEDRAGETGPSHRAELEALARELDVPTQLHFAGQLEDPTPVVALADVCALTSDTEGLSNAVIEYMAAGKPVVASNVGGNGELVEPGVTGHLVAARDVDGLARAFGSLFGDRARAAAFGAAGAQRAERLFTAAAMIARTQALYEELLGAEAPAAAGASSAASPPAKPTAER